MVGRPDRYQDDINDAFRVLRTSQYRPDLMEAEDRINLVLADRLNDAINKARMERFLRGLAKWTAIGILAMTSYRDASCCQRDS